VDADTIVSAIVSGTPLAVPDKPAKLERISLRTTPLRPSTFGPFDPSPGYGPCVSFGIRLHADDVVPPLVVVVVVVVLSVVDVGDVGVLPPQPKSWNAPPLTPARAAHRSRRRLSMMAVVARMSR